MNKLVIDVGGTNIKYALMDMDANILEQGEVPTPLENENVFMDAIVSIYEQYRDRVDGMAFSIPGNMDSKTGQVYTPGALSFNAGKNFIDLVHSRIDLPVTVENDGKCAALAEMWKGNLQGVSNAAVLILGTGIGGGIVANGKLLRGSHFFAGEVSFLMEYPEREGFAKVFAMNGSTTALCMTTAALKQDGNQYNGRQVFELIEKGDAAAKQALDSMCESIATEIFNLQCIIDPDVVCIGGGVSKQPLILKTIEEKRDALYASFPLPVPKAELKTCRFYNDSNLIGALYHYICMEKGE